MLRPVFRPEVTWGNIGQLIGIIACAGVLYGDSRVYKERTDARLARLEERDVDKTKHMDQTDVTIRNLSEALVRVSAFVEARPGFRNQATPPLKP